MKIKALTITALFLLAMIAGPALAAEEPKGQRDTTTQYGDKKMKDHSAGKEMKLQQSGMHKASDIIGEKVVSQQGQDLGSVDNLVLDENGQVQYIILSRGGVLGMGGKLVPIPWQAANLRMSEDQLVCSIDQQQLQNAPSFEGENWAQIADPSYEQEVHSYFGSTPRSGSESSPGMSKPMTE